MLGLGVQQSDSFIFAVFQLWSRVRLFATSGTAAPGLPVLHCLPQSAQTHVHRVGDAIQLSHPLSSPSPPALTLSQHRDLFQWVGSSHLVDLKVLEFQPQHQSFQWLFWINFLYDGLVCSPCSLRDSQESFLTPQFKSINSWALSLLYGHAYVCICILFFFQILFLHRLLQCIGHSPLCYAVGPSCFMFCVYLCIPIAWCVPLCSLPSLMITDLFSMPVSLFLFCQSAHPPRCDCYYHCCYSGCTTRTCGLLPPWPRTEPAAWQWRHGVWNTEPPGNCPYYIFRFHI